MASEQQVSEFWQWFRAVCGQFGERFENKGLIEELDARVARLGDFSWEVGPGAKDERNSALVLTPSGNPALLAETRKVVAAAPDCPGWELYAAKPPKKWLRQFVLYDEGGTKRSVDASGARYVLFRSSDGILDIAIADEHIAALPESLQQTAAEVLLDGELGEEKRMALVRTADVVAEFDDSMYQKSDPIEFLARHVESLVP